MKKRITMALLGTVAMATFFLPACQPDDTLTEVVSETVDDQEYLAAEDQQLAAIGQALALSLHDTEVRQFLYTEVNKFFNGDADVLYHRIKDVALSGTTLRERLAANYQPPGGTQNRAEALEAATRQDAGLTLSISRTLAIWDPATQVPLVAIVPANFDEGETQHVVAYDAKGQARLISAREEPTVPVLVLMHSNERVPASFDENGELVAELPEDVIFVGKEGVQDLQGRTEARYRDGVYDQDTDRERIGAIRISERTYKAYEAWLFGEWELQMAVLFEEKDYCYTNGQTNSPVNVWYWWKRAKNGEWYTFNAPLGNLQWKKSLSEPVEYPNIASVMTIIFSERDQSTVEPYEPENTVSTHQGIHYKVSKFSNKVGAFVEEYTNNLDTERSVNVVEGNGFWFTFNVF